MVSTGFQWAPDLGSIHIAIPTSYYYHDLVHNIKFATGHLNPTQADSLVSHVLTSVQNADDSKNIFKEIEDRDYPNPCGKEADDFVKDRIEEWFQAVTKTGANCSNSEMMITNLSNGFRLPGILQYHLMKPCTGPGGINYSAFRALNWCKGSDDPDSCNWGDLDGSEPTITSRNHTCTVKYAGSTGLSAEYDEETGITKISYQPTFVLCSGAERELQDNDPLKLAIQQKVAETLSGDDPHVIEDLKALQSFGNGTLPMHLKTVVRQAAEEVWQNQNSHKDCSTMIDLPTTGYPLEIFSRHLRTTSMDKSEVMEGPMLQLKKCVQSSNLTHQEEVKKCAMRRNKAAWAVCSRVSPNGVGARRRLDDSSTRRG